MRSETTKICKIRRKDETAILAWTGGQHAGLLLAKWWEAGAADEFWPDCQHHENRWSRLIVARKDYVEFYEQEPIALPVTALFMAWGSGRDYAMGAMAMGASATEAVEIANRFDIDCGLGIDIFDLGELDVR